MRRFVFRFEAVLKLRKRTHDEALRALGAAQRGYQAALSYESELREVLARALGRMGATGAATSAELQTTQAWMSGTRHRIVAAQQAIVRAKRSVERALRVYLDARRKLRAIEHLRSRDWEEYRQALRKREERLQQDLALMRHRLQPTLRPGLDTSGEGAA